MLLADIDNLINRHEDSYIQLKEYINNLDQLVSELIAFSNAGGGKIIVGVNDKTLARTGVTLNEVKQIGQWLGNGSLNNSFPPTYPVQENVALDNNRFIVVITVFEGLHKPYCDNSGVYWLRVGSEKRRARPEDIKRLVAENNHLSVEERVLTHSIMENFDMTAYKKYYEKKYEQKLPDDLALVKQMLINKQLLKGDRLTLAGALLFGGDGELLNPNFCIKAVSFFGNDKATTQYRDSEDFYGSIPYLYRSALAFIKRNMPKVQKDKSFNSIGELEIPILVFEELIANALVHRDYYFGENVELLIFDDRIEINNPGTIPAPLSVEDIKHGLAKPRNQIIVAFITDLIPYRGLGTGIRRALEVYPDIEIKEDRRLSRVSCIIKRPINSQKTPVETPVETPVKTPGLILRQLAVNPKMTLGAVAKSIGKSVSAVERASKKLTLEGKLKYIGSKKGGHWEVG